MDERKLKPSKRWEVEAWTHKASGTRLVIYYDKTYKIFWSHVGSKTITASTQVDAKKAACEAADRALVDESVWERVLIIEEQRFGGRTFGNYGEAAQIQSPSMSFACYRAWRLVTWDGAWMTREWNRAADDVMFGGRFPPGHLANGHDIKPFTKPQDGARIVPYTDELWERLQALARRLGELAVELDRALRSENVVELLMGDNGLPLFGDGKGQA